jgi:hypothetical protein
MPQTLLTGSVLLIMELERSKFDDALSALADPYRRQLLLALREHNPQDDDDHDPLNLLADGEDDELLQSALVHNHLPKLHEMGYIEWNRTTNEISKGPNWDDIAPLLALIEEHQDDLPEGWL